MTRLTAIIQWFEWPSLALCACAFVAGILVGALGL